MGDRWIEFFDGLSLGRLSLGVEFCERSFLGLDLDLDLGFDFALGIKSLNEAVRKWCP